MILNLKQLDKYNAILNATPEIEPAQRKINFYDEDNLLHDTNGYSIKELKFQVTFLGDRFEWQRNQARFLDDLETDTITFGGKIYYRGIFIGESVSDTMHSYNQIQVKGICHACYRKVDIDLKPGKHKIYNKGYYETNLTLDIKGAGEIKGLTKEPIISSSACTITEKKLIVKNDKLALDVVTLWEFPKIGKGLNIVETTVPIRISYYPRLI